MSKLGGFGARSRLLPHEWHGLSRHDQYPGQRAAREWPYVRNKAGAGLLGRGWQPLHGGLRGLAIQILKAVRSPVRAQGWTTFLGFGRPHHGAGCLPGIEPPVGMKGSPMSGAPRRALGGHTTPSRCPTTSSANGSSTSCLSVYPGGRRSALDGDSRGATGRHPGLAVDMSESYRESTRAAVPKARPSGTRNSIAPRTSIKPSILCSPCEHREWRQSGHDTLTNTRYLWLKTPGPPPSASVSPLLHCGSTPSRSVAPGRSRGVCRVLGLSLRRFSQKSLRPLVLLGHPRAPTSGHHRRQDPEAPSAGTSGLYEAPHTHAVAEGNNGRIQLIKANARGYRRFPQYRIAILFHCGGLDLYPAGCTQ